MSGFKVLEDNYEIIKSEYEQIKDDLIDWHQNHLYSEKDGWKVYPIFSYPKGEDCKGFTEKVPQTANLIRNNIKHYSTAGFSRLKAGEVIQPHVGRQGIFLRYHLGIDVPNGDCGLKCDNKIHRWENGKSFVFDDRLEHSAWNKTNQDRIILLIDYVPNSISESERVMYMRKKLKISI